MAIQVSGTSVINDSRQLQNIASVDSTTAASITAAGVGGGPDLYVVPTWGSPQANYTSSTTWSKPGSVGDNSWVTFYLVGGGGSGYNWGANFSQGGHGAAAYIVCILGSKITASVTITVGAGGAASAQGSAGNAGADTTISMGGDTYTASGGLAGSGQQTAATFTAFGGYRLAEQSGFPNAIPLPSDVDGGHSKYSSGATSVGSVFGGAGGGGWYYGQAFPGTSTYGGNGGAYNAAGSVPGGGGGGGLSGGSNAGGGGSVRIYY
jgi:hypothetical protein